MVITVNASDVAAIAGLNKYRSPAEFEVRKGGFCSRKRPKVYEKIPAAAAKALGGTEDAHKALRRLVGLAGDGASVKTLASKVGAELRKAGAAPQMNEAQRCEELRSVRNKCMGSREECPALDLYESVHGVKVTDRNDRLYVMRLRAGAQEFEIRGKIDGLQRQTNAPDVLVEIKNRRNRLFGGIPIYEKVQLEVYLRMLDLQKAALFQRHKASNTHSTLRYGRDDALWAEVVAGLKRFSSKERGGVRPDPTPNVSGLAPGPVVPDEGVAPGPVAGLQHRAAVVAGPLPGEVHRENLLGAPPGAAPADDVREPSGAIHIGALDRVVPEDPEGASVPRVEPVLH